MPEIPVLTEEDVRARVSEEIFKRGYSYFQKGMVFHIRRQGMTIKGWCQGSQPESYRVQVNFSASDILSADCSCPVGEGGYCKHTVALLLEWLEHPDAFQIQQELETLLQEHSKDDLMKIILYLARLQPDLQDALETLLSGSKEDSAPVDPKVYKKQAIAIFRKGGDSWGAETAIARQLLSIVYAGDTFLLQQEYANAATVFGALADVMIEQYTHYSDENGDLADVLIQCVVGLGECLKSSPPDEQALRIRILQSLFDIYCFNVEAGELGLAENVPELIITQTTPEERSTVLKWVKDALPQESDWSSKYRRQDYGAFILELEKDTLDDERFLEICWETGRFIDMVDRLLSLNRIKEAVSEARQVGDYDLLQIADLFVHYHHDNEAEKLMLERCKRSQDTRLLIWLKNRYLQKQNIPLALTMTRQLFFLSPGVDLYKELRNMADHEGNWQNLRADLLSYLRKNKRYSLLIELYLQENELDNAISVSREFLASTPSRWYTGDVSLDMVLATAHASEKRYPEVALEFYRQQASGLIAQRGRDSYQHASDILSRIHNIYVSLGREDEWASYITELRERNRSLRALKEELAAAGL